MIELLLSEEVKSYCRRCDEEKIKEEILQTTLDDDFEDAFEQALNQATICINCHKEDMADLKRM